MRVLIIEDEKKLAEATVSLLQKNGFAADSVFDGETGLDYAESGIYDIILLDIMLPKMNGSDILKSLRKSKNHTPVIVITAKSDSCTEYLNLGADDYIQKPYRGDELIARIRAVLRRNSEISEIESPSFGDIELSVPDMTLMCKGKTVSLTKKESGLMEYLMANKNIVVSKEQIIRKMWGFDSEADANHVEVYISFLRKKLSFLKSRTEIATVRGIGYKLIESQVKHAQTLTNQIADD